MDKQIVRKEIGSEFWAVPTQNHVLNSLPDNTKWFISGTSALEFIIIDILKESTIASVAIPSWCCSCMFEPFLKYGINLKFYSIYFEDGCLICDYSSVKGQDVTLAMSFFGYAAQKTIGSPTGIVIRDVTHSVFSKFEKDADYYFGSLRKWAGFWTGGIAWKSGRWLNNEIFELDINYESLRKTAMEIKQGYLLGDVKDKSYLSLYEKAEEYLESCPVMKGSDRDVETFKHLDIESIRTQRKNNARYLLEKLRDIALFKTITESDCPLFFPILLETQDRDDLRKYLIENEFFCPIHWGLTENHLIHGKQKNLYEQELSLVCDQRYDEYDMERLVKALECFVITEGRGFKHD